MILQNIASKQGKLAGRNGQSWTKHRRRAGYTEYGGSRYYGAGAPAAVRSTEQLARDNVNDLSKKNMAKRQAKAIDRDFFLSVLGSTATKRDARSYIKRFTPPQDEAPRPTAPKIQTKVPPSCGVNLGTMYDTVRAVTESPKFVQQPEIAAAPAAGPPLHIALVKIRAPQRLSDETLAGVGTTLSQLGRLGMTSVVVVDTNDDTQASPAVEDPSWRRIAMEQANRISLAIDSRGEINSRVIDNVVGVSEQLSEAESPAYLRARTHITLRKLLMTPLRRGVIPVIPAIGYTDEAQTSVPVKASNVVLALTRELAGLCCVALSDEDPDVLSRRLQALRSEVSLDRLIILEPFGGIPTSDRTNGYHVFLNMEQEFGTVKKDLLKITQVEMDSRAMAAQDNPISDLGLSNPFSRLAEIEFGSMKTPDTSNNSEQTETEAGPPGSKFHLENLELVRRVLAMLPSSSSALLTTPDEAASAGKEPDTPFQAAGVGTRRQRNPLIHNLLTDKPVFSSSLPHGRIASSPSDPLSPAMRVTSTTFAKRGMSVTVIPDPLTTPWEPPLSGSPQVTLTDPRIDLPRLVHLIDDSFNRTLDVKDYLNRVNDRIAGVIIAGEYEGGALLTWELPPGVTDRRRMVPYLDKFAVLKRSQGSGGVADIVFKAMVKDCFPQGCVWRSRQNNPVNKWYFERSSGTWKLNDTGWTMFWTTPDVSITSQTFADYEAVCRSIQPSWADGKKTLD